MRRRPSPRLHAFRASLATAAWALALVAPLAHGAIVWDGEASTQWWFNPINWNVASNSNTVLPPSNDAAGASANDTQINIGTGGLPGGEGVVYDPALDPGFPPPGTIPFPTGFAGGQTIQQLYISRANPSTNTLTVKGDLAINGQAILGRSSGTRGVTSQGNIVLKNGKLTVNNSSLDLGQSDTGTNPPALGNGNGTFEYQAGILEVSQSNGNGLRLSLGTNSPAQDLAPAGPGGIGKFIMRNPASGGYVRPWSMTFGGFSGLDEGAVGPTDSVFNAAVDPNGTTTGVAIAEFHYENGGVRPFQIATNLSINNGTDQNTLGVRSARIDLKLQSPVAFKSGTVPVDLPLFDVGFNLADLTTPTSGALIAGAGALARTFSSADGLTNYPQDAIVSASLGNTTYNWKISYTGKISFANLADANNSIVSTVEATGGTDVVLIGFSSQTTVVEDADFNNSGRVDGADFLTWQRNFNGAGATNLTGDANGDTNVNGADFAIWKAQFGNPFPATGAAVGVPEPGTFALVGATVLALAATRRRASR